MRHHEALARDRRRLHALEPGGSADHPIEVASASVIEPHARGLDCARCGPMLRIVEQASHVVAGRVMRTVRLRCAHCGDDRVVHYGIVPPLVQ